MTAADLIALAERVERMTTNEEPRRDTLLEIFRAARPRSSFEQGWQSDEARHLFVMMWEAGGCTDAAEALIPDAADAVRTHRSRMTDGTWRCYASLDGSFSDHKTGKIRDIDLTVGPCATVPLALLAVALRARAMELDQ